MTQHRPTIYDGAWQVDSLLALPVAGAMEVKLNHFEVAITLNFTFFSVTGTVLPCKLTKYHFVPGFKKLSYSPHGRVSYELHDLVLALCGDDQRVRKSTFSFILYSNIKLLYHRFFIGTFLVETILKYFGRYQLEDSTKSFLPRSFLHFAASRRNIGHSASQGRHRVLILASIIHALYFILMGSRAGFPVMFVAYALAAFSRAILTAPLWVGLLISRWVKLTFFPCKECVLCFRA